MKLISWIAVWLLLLAYSAGYASGYPQAGSSTNPAPAATSTAPAKASSASGVTTSEIAAAKANHKVWVNLDSGVYHKGGRWYGKTKNGKFMTEDEAKKAGYKAAKRD